MKTLFLVRHGKSSWDNVTLSDRERPLAERGRRDAEKMSARLARRGVKLDLILSSPATRALATAQVFSRRLRGKHRGILVDERLYANQTEMLLNLLQELNGKLKRVMLVGHNPELAELAEHLSGRLDQLPTCAVVRLKFDTKDWSDIGTLAPDKVTLKIPKKP